jgi:hypothetical protein|uniref:Uncharacterized protein n=1 Tax=viral metagenome TaxID=1070528 RepID=A0A6C0H0X0_9ZZZZ
MKTINNILNEYLKIIGGDNSKLNKEDKINNLINKIISTGDSPKKIIAIKTIDETDNVDIIKKQLLDNLTKNTSIHQFFSESSEF